MTSSASITTNAKPAPNPGGFAVRLFGPMEVLVGGAPIRRLRSRKGMWLVALLALRADHDVDRSWLAGTLWPDADDGSAFRNLRQTLHDLRAALGAEAWRLPTGSTRTLRLDSAGAVIDVAEFDRLAALDEPAAAESAVQLYRGPLLEDCSEEWVSQERRQRELACITALETLADGATSRGDYIGTVTWLRRAIQIDPFREDLSRALMQAFAAAGDTASAMQVYRDLRSRLWREMNAAPADATSALHNQIREDARRAGKHPSAPPLQAPPEALDRLPVSPLNRRGSLPSPLTNLVGRDESIAEIRFHVSNSRLVTLIGSGGIGKTRLAVQTAREMAAEFADGACFVDLAPLADGARLPEAIRYALGLPAGEFNRAPADAIACHLANRNVLMVLDNCEHLVRDCAILAESLLTTCSNLRILCTSRHALSVLGETVWRVPPLDLPHAAADSACPNASSPSGRPRSPADCGAIQLFVQRARAAEPSFGLTLSNAPVVADICRRIDGIPLAIELAAARARSISLEDIRDRLRSDFDLLDGSVSGSSRHETLHATFEWSWNLLNDRERHVLARASAFSGGWTLQAAEAVCADEHGHSGHTLQTLSSLVDKSLVLFTPRPAECGGVEAVTASGRYHLLETVRALAAQRLDAAELCAVRSRHLDYYLRWAEEIAPRLTGPDQAEGFAQLDVEHNNLRAALEWAVIDGNVEVELRLCVALSRFWDTCGPLGEGRQRLEAALWRIPENVGPRLRADALGRAAWMAHVQADNLSASRYFEEALALYRELGDSASVRHVLNLLACATLNLGDAQRADALFRESLDLSRGLGNRVGEASVLNNMGEAALRRGDLAAARRCLEESAALSEGAANYQLHAITLCGLAVADIREGRLDTAGALCARGLQTFARCSAVVGMPGALVLMGVIARRRDQWQRAALLLAAGRAQRSSLGVPRDPLLAPDEDESQDAISAVLGARMAEDLSREGGEMNLSEAVSFALDALLPT